MHTFMEKYIYNTLEDPSEEDSDKENMITSEPTKRSQMRGFELITKLFEIITIQDWLKV